MADKKQLEVLLKGVREWNWWRGEHPGTKPDLAGADLRNAKLGRADLEHANLEGADLAGAALSDALLVSANLSRTNLGNADLTGARLTGARLFRADLRDANLTAARLDNAQLSLADLNSADLRRACLIGAVLGDAELRSAKLGGADLSYTNLGYANLTGADLSDANISAARTGHTIFADVDLSRVKGLEDVVHTGPSEVSVSTLYKSEGKIPELFLRGCGVPEAFIVQIPALVAAMQPIQFYSCFISYSSRDEEFARRLHSRTRQAELRVWFAPEDMKGGDKIHDQIDRAIQLHDRLLLVLSESSMRSRWVENEIRRARKVELSEGRRKLFPIRLVSYEALQEWACIDSSTGEDLAEEVRSYFIPDFSNWKSHDAFERAFARLLADLKAST